MRYIMAPDDDGDRTNEPRTNKETIEQNERMDKLTINKPKTHPTNDTTNQPSTNNEPSTNNQRHKNQPVANN